MLNRIFALKLLIFLTGILTACLSWAESEKVRISTNLGDIVIELFPDQAPASVDNFKQYVRDGFYNGTIFHRVIDGFMIQGGGYTADFRKKDTQKPIQNEANNGLKNNKYTIAMARTSAPHSATSQFFINTVDNDFLNHTSMDMRGWGYTVFGRVVKGQEVVDAIGQTETGSGGPFARDVPVDTVSIDITSFVVPEQQETEAMSAAEKPADKAVNNQ